MDNIEEVRPVPGTGEIGSGNNCLVVVEEDCSRTITKEEGWTDPENLERFEFFLFFYSFVQVILYKVVGPL